MVIRCGRGDGQTENISICENEPCATTIFANRNSFATGRSLGERRTRKTTRVVDLAKPWYIPHPVIAVPPKTKTKSTANAERHQSHLLLPGIQKYDLQNRWNILLPLTKKENKRKLEHHGQPTAKLIVLPPQKIVMAWNLILKRVAVAQVSRSGGFFLETPGKKEGLESNRSTN